MHRRSIQIMTAAALAALAGQAVAQKQLSPTEARRMSQKLQESDKSLTDAIQLAERETGGKALAAEIMTSTQRMDSGQQDRDIRRPGDEPDQRERDRQRDRESTPDQDRQQENRDRLTQTQQRGLHASVTCLVNDTELRRVIVDLEEGRVVQTQSIGAGGDNERLTRQTDMSAGAGSQMRLASDLINSNVVNAQDEDLGDIDDLALDVTSGQVRYAVLKAGGLLGMGGDMHAVPLKALMFVGDDEVRLSMTQEQLEQRDGFDTDRWPQKPSGAWGGSGQQGQQPDREGRQPEVQRPGQQGQQEMSSTVEKASDVIGATVHGPGDASVGDVHDMVIKPSDSSISHYIITTDEGKVAVPASEIQMSNRRLTLAMEQSEFEQLPRFRDNENPDWTNPSWLRDNERDRNPQRDERDPARRGGG